MLADAEHAEAIIALKRRFPIEHLRCGNGRARRIRPVARRVEDAQREVILFVQCFDGVIGAVEIPHVVRSR